MRRLILCLLVILMEADSFWSWGIRPPGGWKQAGRLTYLVSCGYGTTLLPLRFGARAEAHFITLLSAEK
ncbi:hypothetical protein [Sinobaca sp. H24]|uniref:hypothetical protein n=1 Tax=Sinobaca sp. H24 TaxID=2923376 RepID=UPI00207B04ED|nr:hypothetical protein [Sinobaca sp. H24]